MTVISDRQQQPLSEWEIRTVLQLAGLAPSVHNTQPWSFAVIGHSIEVRADANRKLDYLDPAGRQMMISCGAAVENARLAIRGLGRACVVRWLPDPRGDLSVLATLTVGGIQPATPEERRLVDAIARRYTDRGPYSSQQIPDLLLARVRAAVGGRGCWLRVLNRPGDRVIVANLLQRAETVESADPEYLVELARWVRDRKAPDGIPPDALPVWSGQVSDVPLRDFTGRRPHPRPGTEEPPPAVERDTLLLIGSDDDSPLSWLRTGSALGLLLLLLTDAGVAAQPLGPVTDVPSTREWLRRELGLLGAPQLLLRAGYGSGVPVTGRRSVAETLHPAG